MSHLRAKRERLVVQNMGSHSDLCLNRSYKKNTMQILSSESEDECKENQVRNPNRVKKQQPNVERKKEFVSDVEILRRKNVEARQKMFEQLKLAELKQEMEQNTRSTKKTPRKTTHVDVEDESTEPRRSDRIKSQPRVNYAFDVNSKRQKLDHDDEDEYFEDEDFSIFSEGTCVLNLKSAIHGDLKDLEVEHARQTLMNLFPEDSVEDIEKIESVEGTEEEKTSDDSEQKVESFEIFLQKMNSLTFREENTSKVVSQITCLALNPMSSNILVAAGGKSGQVGLWKLASEDESSVLLFDFHARPVNLVTFDAKNHQLMYTSSSDGAFYESDLNKQSFSLVCESELDGKCMHAQLKPKVFLLSQRTGIVSVDLRQRPAQFTRFRSKDEVSNISVHPGSEMHFATLSKRSTLAIWDMRQMKQELSSISLKSFEAECGKCCFFSPLTGNLTLVSSNKYFKVVDTHNLERPELLMKFPSSSIDRRVAIWHPQREDVFLTGSLEKLELFQVSCTIEPLTSMSYKCDMRSMRASEVVYAFHPTIPAVAVGNANGKVAVLM